MKIPLGRPRSIDAILDRMEQLREDAERACMTSLLLRAHQIDCWDQVAETMDDYREATKGWREETRRALLAEFAAVGWTP